MSQHVGLVSHLFAFLAYALLTFGLLAGKRRTPGRLALAGASAVMAGWALLLVQALRSAAPYSDYVQMAETLRSAGWIGFIALMMAPAWRRAGDESSSRAILVALSAILGMLFLVDAADRLGSAATPLLDNAAIAYLFLMGRLAVAIGGLLLTHNLYVNTLPFDRWGIRLLCIAMAGLFGYDLNLYTLQLLSGQLNIDLFIVRGAVNALLVPLFLVSMRRNRALRLHISRQVVFHSLSLGAVGLYLVAMSLAAYGLRLVGGDWGLLLQASFLFAMALLAVIVLFSGRFRAWARVQIAKHFFAYKYDYRQEWLKFIGTVARAEDGYGDLQMRVVQAVCEIIDCPGGALYTPSDDGLFEMSARWNYRTVVPGHEALDGPLADYLRSRRRIVNLDELRARGGDYDGVPLPGWAAADERAWLIVPLIHIETLTGFIVLERPLAAQQLNWEDFDVLRTVGKQVASYIAEANSQAALLEARKFDEFNRRFAFIMHDIKNLVSQLSLVARNAERHADNPEFRADMVKTLQSSVGKLNDLLARLAQHNTARPDETPAVDVGQIVVAVAGQLRPRHAAIRLHGMDDHGGQARVAADPGRLEQVFTHVLQNAIDASAADAPIDIDLACRGDQVTVSITDVGCGMSANFIRDGLFKPFQSTKQGGFGIGAYEAREIIRGFGGRLEVSSREGEGSQFRIILPLLQAGGTALAPDERVGA